MKPTDRVSKNKCFAKKHTPCFGRRFFGAGVLFRFTGFPLQYLSTFAFSDEGPPRKRKLVGIQSETTSDIYRLFINDSRR